jgi:hypothetical protein
MVSKKENMETYSGFGYWWNIHLLLRINSNSKDGIKVHDWMFL